MEETTAQALEVVVNVQQSPELFACLGFIAVLLTFIWLSMFYNR